MSRGRRLRRREANFKEAHGLNRALSSAVPAPTGKEVEAIPSKLKRLIALKNLAKQGGKRKVWADGRKVENSSRTANGGKGDAQAHELAKNRKGVELSTRKPEEANTKRSHEDGVEKSAGAPPSSEGEKEAPLPPRKRGKKKGDEELDKVLDLCHADRSARLAEKKKRKRGHEGKKERLKKKKMKQLAHTGEAAAQLRPLHEREEIRFGDIVQAPPKLMRPTLPKALKGGQVQEHESEEGEEGDVDDTLDPLKVKESVRHFPATMGWQSLSKERLREHMVHLYRKKKGRGAVSAGDELVNAMKSANAFVQGDIAP